MIAPLPLVLVQRGPVSMRMLRHLHDDERIELFAVESLTRGWLAFADRTSGIIVATTDEPLSGLLYALTAGVRVPVVVAARAVYSDSFRDVVRAGGAGCVTLPISAADVDRLLRMLHDSGAPAVVDADLRLVLDPIARVVRFHDRTIRLTQREFALLYVLSSHHGRPVAADDLYRYVWADSRACGQPQQILAVYVFQLRQKLARIGLKDALATVRGFGYSLTHATSPSTH